MDENPKDLESQFMALARAVRFGFTAIVIGLSYPNILFATRIPLSEQLFHDIFGDKPLPWITRFGTHAQPFLMGFSILVPLAAIVFSFVVRPILSIYISTFLILVVLAELIFTWHALVAPCFLL